MHACVHSHISPLPSLPSQPHTSHSSQHWTADSSDEEFGYHDDTLAFQAALAELRAVVGAEAAEEMLTDLLLAADCNVNRALNYFFGTEESS